jgi:serine/threonine protein phosphatase PrpC
MNMNRISLGSTVSNVPVSSSGTSSPPMNGPPKDAVSVGKKYRSSSRQSSGQRHRKSNKYGDGMDGPPNLAMTQQQQQQQAPRPILGTTNMPASPDSTAGSGGFFPQINNNSNTPHAQKKSMSNYATPNGGNGASMNNTNSFNTQNALTNMSLAMNNNGAISPAKESNYTSANGVTTEEYQYGCVTSIKGLKPGNPNWINQDNFFMMESFDNRDTRIYCVLDGHGEFGHLVSRRCREHFPHFLISNNLKMDSAFNMMHNDLNSSEIDVRCSGATCVLACIQGGKVTVYNCGDSRAVLGRRNTAGAITAIQLSNDHKPDKPEERKRIISCGGHLGCRQVLVNQGNRGPVSMPVGPCRVWYQHRGETLGLAMSRSLGDAIVHKFGVSCDPEPMDHVIDEYDDFVILATDGIWDVVENNQAVQLIYNYIQRATQTGNNSGGNSWNALEASSHLCKYARSRWEKLSPMIDDITCIIVKLQR